MNSKHAALLTAPVAVLGLAVGIVVANLSSDGTDSPPNPAGAPTTSAGSNAGAPATQPAPSHANAPPPQAGAGNPGAVDPGRTAPNGNSVLYTFDAQPGSPEPAYWLSGWDVQVHSRDADRWFELDPMAAQHGPGCEAPPATHEMSSYEDAVFLCKDHIMTSVLGEGYAAVYLTPPEMVDFSTGEAVIRFDVSTERTSPSRDWWDVWITPFDQNLTIPLEFETPDGQGPAMNAIQVRLNAANQLCVNDYRNAENVAPPPNTPGDNCVQTGYEEFLTPSPATRTPFEIRISKTNVRVSMLNADGKPVHVFHDYFPEQPIAFGTGVVQFGHHSYNPKKEDGGQPGTWHWDNIGISPALPFSLIRADKRFVENDGRVTFPAPAPDGAHLRFSAIGKVQVSFDGGENWRDAEKQKAPLNDQYHFSTYWTPIPAGTTSVAFRIGEDRGYADSDFQARDITVWAPR